MCGNSRSGAAQYRQALKLDPNDPMAHDNLGCIFAEQGHQAEAHRLWQWVLAHPEAGHVHPDGTGDHGAALGDVRQMLVKYL